MRTVCDDFNHDVLRVVAMFELRTVDLSYDPRNQMVPQDNGSNSLTTTEGDSLCV